MRYFDHRESSSCFEQHYPHAQQHRFNHHGHGQQRGIHQGFAHKGGSQQDKRQSGKAAQEMRTDDLMRASSPMLTRILVDMLREGEAGKARAWVFFEKICNLNKADVYQYSVMLNACSDSYASEKLMQKMGAAGIQPSEVGSCSPRARADSSHPEPSDDACAESERAHASERDSQRGWMVHYTRYVCP